MGHYDDQREAHYASEQERLKRLPRPQAEQHEVIVQIASTQYQLYGLSNLGRVFTVDPGQDFENAVWKLKIDKLSDKNEFMPDGKKPVEPRGY